MKTKLAPIRRPRRGDRELAYGFARNVRDGDYVAIVTLGIRDNGSLCLSYAAPNRSRLLQLIGSVEVVGDRLRKMYLTGTDDV